jgi:hypothetical protein
LGQVGKEKIHRFGALSYRIVLTASFALLSAEIVSCAADQTLTYTGLLVPRAGACDTSTRAVLLRKKSRVQFVPSDGVIVLEGTSSGGEIVAQRKLVDMNHATYTLHFTGEVHGDHVSGAYVTPRCRYEIDLARRPG